jgi:hypothetical protein
MKSAFQAGNNLSWHRGPSSAAKEQGTFVGFCQWETIFSTLTFKRHLCRTVLAFELRVETQLDGRAMPKRPNDLV